MASGQTVLQNDSSTVAYYMHLAGLKPLQSFDYRHGDTTIYTVRVSAIEPGEHPLFVRVDFNFNTEIVTWQRGRALCWQNDERGILDEGSYLLPRRLQSLLLYGCQLLRRVHAPACAGEGA